MTDLGELTDVAVAEYRELSVAAVVGLIVGLLTPLALAHPLLWFLPVAGVLLNGTALWKIRRREPALAGRAAARWGLGLSLFFAAAAPTDWLVYRWRTEAEARQFALFWFGLLARGQPEKAFQLTQMPDNRQPLDDRLWEYYRRNPPMRIRLEDYVAPALEGEPPPLVRTLLALGDSAEVRFQKTLAHDWLGATEFVDQLYSVTFEGSDGKKTFFLMLCLTRQILPDGKASWRLVSASGIKTP